MSDEVFVPLNKRKGITILEFKNRTVKYAVCGPLSELFIQEKNIKYKKFKVKKESDVLECLKEVYKDIELTMGIEYHSSGTTLTYKEARRLVLRTLKKRFGEVEEK